MCGKSACTVRRGEGPNSIGPSYPYLTSTVSGPKPQDKVFQWLSLDFLQFLVPASFVDMLPDTADAGGC